MKFLSVAALMALCFSSFAHASPSSCFEEMRALYSHKTQPVSSTKRKGLAPLIARAQSHYLKEVDFDGTIDPKDLYVEESALFYKGNTPTGYRIDLTDGGDESLVSYYFTIHGELIYAKWHNQSPVSFWICGRY